MMSIRTTRLMVAIVTPFLWGQASAAPGQATDVVKAAPALTPGAAVLMVSSALRPPDIERLRQAAADADPVVRAVVARAAAVRNIPAFAAAIGDALAREDDETVAAEQIRAVLTLDPAGGMETAERHLPRGGAAGAHVYFRWLQAHDPNRLPARILELLRDLSPGEVQRMATVLLELETAPDREIRAQLLDSWLRVRRTTQRVDARTRGAAPSRHWQRMSPRRRARP